MATAGTRPYRPEMDWTMDPELPHRFRQWKREVKNEILLQTAEDSDNKKAAYACTYVIVCAGEQGEQILTENGLIGERKDFNKIITCLESSVTPSSNFLEDSVNYFYMKQGDSSVRQFQRELEHLIERMIPNYDPTTTLTHKEMKALLLRNALLVGLRDKTVLKDCHKLRREECTAKKILDMAYQAEIRDTANKRIARNFTATSTSALQDIARDTDTTSSLHRMSSKPAPPRQNQKQVCRWCGGPQFCRRTECPAYGKKCSNCHKMGHFDTVCRQKQPKIQNSTQPKVHNIELNAENIQEESQSVYDFNQLSDAQKPTNEHIKPLWISTPDSTSIHQVSVEIDTGAACNVMPKYMYIAIFGDKKPQRSQAKIRAYGNTPVHIIGKCDVLIHTADGKKTPAKFEITLHNGHPIIGRDTCTDIGYITFPTVQPPPMEEEPVEHEVKSLKQQIKIPQVTRLTPTTVNVNGKTHTLPVSKAYIMTEFKDVFDGLGELPGGEHHLRLKPNTIAVQHAPRQVPEKKKMAYKEELERLQREGVIVKEDGYTDWVNSIVPALKPDGSIRLCLDPKDLNECLERNSYYTKTVNELSSELSGSKYFTVMDAKQGYWHVPLDLESSKLTTFNTPWGKYRFTRLPFGLKVSGDIFQERLDAVLNQLPGVTNIVDDCMVKAPTCEDHDVSLLTLLHTARLNGIKFNSKKIQFRQDKVHFFGHIITPMGISISKEAAAAVMKMKPPTDKQTLQSFLGMVNYMKKFSKDLTKLTHPLRELVKQNTVFRWEQEQQEAFEAIKSEITRAPTLSFFDRNKKHVIQTDASIKGLGAVLLQDGQPVMYVSRSLLPAEENYSNIERELLSVIFGLERLHNYIFGEEIELHTDHQPLVSILKKQVCDTSPRLQRLLLRAHKYDVRVKYIKGSNNQVADALSRVSPLPPLNTDVLPDKLIPLHTLTNDIPANSTCFDTVRSSTAADASLQQLAQYVHHGWPQQRSICDPKVQQYWNDRAEISLEDGILFRGTQMIIPEELRARFIEKLHEAHMGEEKSLLLARTTIYWPHYTEDIRQRVRDCCTCQSTRPSQQKEDLLPHEVPAGPWIKLGVDYFEWNQRKYLLVCDYYSRFPILKSMATETATALVTTLKTIFSEYGFPEEIMSDQGPQFCSDQYLSMAKNYDIKITHSSPRYPRSNGFIESMVKVVKQILERCKRTGSDPHVALLMYRATPLKSGMASPAELLSQRRLKTTLPTKNMLSDPLKAARKKMADEKDRITELHNQRAKEYRDLELHEPVYMKTEPEGEWKRATIIETPTDTPRSYGVQLPSGQTFTRNRSHIRPDRGVQSDAAIDPGQQPHQQTTQTEPRPQRERRPPTRLQYSVPGGTNDVQPRE